MYLLCSNFCCIILYQISDKNHSGRLEWYLDDRRFILGPSEMTCQSSTSRHRNILTQKIPQLYLISPPSERCSSLWGTQWKKKKIKQKTGWVKNEPKWQISSRQQHRSQSNILAGISLSPPFSDLWGNLSLPADRTTAGGGLASLRRP